MSSQEISAMTAAFNQQTAMQMQNSTMISQMAGGHPSNSQAAERFTGGLMNKTAAIGAPVGMLGLGLAGLDPMSLGMRGAFTGFGMGSAMTGGSVAGGVLGGAAMSAGLALPAMAIGAGVQYTGHHMMQGMQQQQMLNSTLRSTYNFANQQGGRGFTTTEMGDIGQQFRQMTQQRGPGGEFTTMDELGRLAANMGRMGMSQGVKSAKEFNEKFQQMMTSVKDIAQTFSTTLEEAQKTMASMKLSGVFRGQAGFGKMMHGAAVGGNLALSEVSAMASLGSQMSRAIGGRGNAGAVAGVTAIGRVGAAVESGVLSEEDIYNSTGLTGAQGRQAFGASMLQGDAEFFKSSRGRRVIAALAQKNGRLDESGVEDFMEGRVGTDGTMQRAHGHLAKVGRANFIRNEGLLRGEAMRQFGGLGRVAVYRGWMKQRGFNLDDDSDDRAQLFLQRQTGMDDDQANNMMKLIKNLPQIRDQQGQSLLQDKLMRGNEIARRHTGIEGLKHKFEGFRNQIQGGIQQVGADIYSDVVQYAENIMDQAMGRAHDFVYKDLARDVRRSMSGSTRKMSEFSGVGARGRVGGSGDHLQNWKHVNMERMEEAGFHFKGATSMSDINKYTQRYQRQVSSFNAGGSSEVADFFQGNNEAQIDLLHRMALGDSNVHQKRGSEYIEDLSNITADVASRHGYKGKHHSAGAVAGAANDLFGGKKVRMPGSIGSGYGPGMSEAALAYERGSRYGRLSQGEDVAAMRGTYGDVAEGAGEMLLGNAAPVIDSMGGARTRKALSRSILSPAVRLFGRASGLEDAVQERELSAVLHGANAREMQGGEAGISTEERARLAKKRDAIGWRAVSRASNFIPNLVAGALGYQMEGESLEDSDKYKQARGAADYSDDVQSARAGLLGARTSEGRIAALKAVNRGMQKAQKRGGTAGQAESDAFKDIAMYSDATYREGDDQNLKGLKDDEVAIVHQRRLSQYWDEHKDELRKGNPNLERGDYLDRMRTQGKMYSADRDAQASAFRRHLGDTSRGESTNLFMSGLRDKSGKFAGAAAEAFKGGEWGGFRSELEKQEKLRGQLTGDKAKDEKIQAELEASEQLTSEQEGGASYQARKDLQKRYKAAGLTGRADRLGRELDVQERLAKAEEGGGSSDDKAERRMKVVAGSLGLSTEGIGGSVNKLLGRVDAAAKTGPDGKPGAITADAAKDLKEKLEQLGKIDMSTSEGRAKAAKLTEEIGGSAGAAGLRKAEADEQKKSDPTYQALEDIKTALEPLKKLSNIEMYTGQTSRNTVPSNPKE
jgi:hypothetical protein